jgi:hypothetical protein
MPEGEEADDDDFRDMCYSWESEVMEEEGQRCAVRF